MKPISIDVPATSANLGPGFDALGLALGIADRYRVDFGDEDGEVTLEHTNVAINRVDNLVCAAYARWGRDLNVRLPGARFALEQRQIPIARGLGSSAAAVVAGLAAGAQATGTRGNEARDRMVRLATEFEGHADNGVAAVLGGLTVGFCDGTDVRAIHVANHLHLGVSLFIPDDELLTSRARAVLPGEVTMADAVHDVGRAAYLVTALFWGRWELIGQAMHNRLHHPYRAPLTPAADSVMAAAQQAGAYGAAFSGGGPSIIAFGPVEGAEGVAEAMQLRGMHAGWLGCGVVTRVREFGVRVREIEEDPGTATL